MDTAWMSVVLLASMALLLGGGVWIAFALLGVGLVAMELFTDTKVGPLMATTIWGGSASWALTALPLFIWMGEILVRTRISEDMFRGLAPWLTRLPGRLMHSNVIGCGIFAAISGSSAATCATIGRMTVPELGKRGYHEPMLIGSLAGSGTLGLLIPPSIIMIVYGVAAEVSIARLFIAGVIPGIVLMALFSGYIAVWSMLNPDKTPPADPPTTLGFKLKQSRLLIPTVLLIVGIIGSIYTGIATPTEAAVVGVVGSLALSGFSGSMTWATFRETVMGAVRTNCMILFIMTGAAFLTTAMGFTGIPKLLAEWITEQGLSAGGLIIVLTLLFIVLGCFLDGISMVLLTAAVVLPSVQAVGINLLWFGIFVVIVVEMAQITPPVGFNLFVLQSLTGKDLFTIGRYALPFFLLMVVAVAAIYFIPDLVTWLPRKMLGFSS
jgi:tripartite ATP-independent transporter DctM subunit